MSAKLTALTATGIPAATDITYVVTDPAGVPVSQKCTIANLAAAILNVPQITGVTTSNSDFLTTLAIGFFGRDDYTQGMGFSVNTTSLFGERIELSNEANTARTYLVPTDDKLVLRNAAGSQALEVYHTFTDAGNYQRATLKNNAASIELVAETAGTGADNIDVLLTPVGTGIVLTSKSLRALNLGGAEVTESATNGLSEFWVAYGGYLHGTTVYRDVRIGDGRGNAVFSCTGQYKEAYAESNLRIGHSTLTYAGSTDLDFRGTTGYQTCALTGNITFTTSNLAAGRSKTIRIQADGSIRTFTFPAWVFVGAAAPASIAANKTAILTITSFGATDANCVASYSEEP